MNSITCGVIDTFMYTYKGESRQGPHALVGALPIGKPGGVSERVRVGNALRSTDEMA
jgi:hypothetical protein